jgi:hypothetical protein
MLLLKFKRKAAKTQRRKGNLLKIFAPLRFCALAFLLFLISCGSPPTDLRSLAPADTLVYLETNDLGKALGALTESKAFQDAARRTPDFSALQGMQTAIAVTGFEASENQVTAENSVLNFKPRFVAIADTHTWHRYTLSFTEERLGGFVNETYGGEVTLAAGEKNGGQSFIWTAKDGRKAFAFVKDSKIFFSNDETALEKSLAVLRGEADSLVKNEALGKMRETAGTALAFGYVSADGIAQISNLAGVSTALEATDDDEGRSFIARVLPQILRNSVKEVFWTATKTGQGIEDKYTITLMPETAAVVKETLIPAAQTESQAKLIAYVPPDAFSVTRYNLQNPQIAWRSLLLVAGKNTDAMSAKILIAFSGSLLEPYGVTDAETFLSAVDSEIWTVNFDPEGEKTAVIVAYDSDEDLEKLKKSVAEINFKKPFENAPGGAFWTSEDKETTFLLTGGLPGQKRYLILGASESVKKCIETNFSYLNKEASPQYRNFYDGFAGSNAVAVTYGKDSTEKIVEVLGEKKAENLQMLTNYKTETRFNASGIERRTVSPFGLIGRILEQFDD